VELGRTAQKKAFAMAKRIITREVLLAYPDFSKPFQIHTDASHYQLGPVISQDGKPIAFYNRKLKPEQTRYTTMERELLSIVETLKEYRNILLGHEIEVFTDHKNLTYKEFNTERVMRWQLLLEEFGPKLMYIKGVNNVVADFLSRMNIHPQELSADAFANEVDFPTEYPLSFGQIQHEQAGDKEIQKLLKSKPDSYEKKEFKHSNKTYSLVTKEDKIVLPKKLQKKAT
jgi:RNase H-like domain found in reverse transcriptase